MERPAPVALLYVTLCLALWAVPLLRVLHAESSALVAGVAFFASGLSAIGAFGAGAGFAVTLRRHLGLLAIPWALLTVTLLWTPNLGYAQGGLLFVTFAPPSVALAVSMAYALTAGQGRSPRRAFLLVSVLVLVATPLFDLGLHPQFYHYNHVFGGVLGPIYDEELMLRPGLFAFRGLTLLWACAVFLLGAWRRGEPVRNRLVAALVLIGVTYAAGGWLGINTPAWRLRQALPGHVQTAHFDLYFDPDALSAEAARRVAREHEWRYAQLRETLGVDAAGRVQSYLYPDARTRGRLTGAAVTSVAPVWLPRPQMHLLQHRLADVLAHELVHVFSRGFGLPLVRASRQVGLVEGLAVALEPPDGLPSPHEQVISAALATGDTLLADRVARALGAGGFWTGRGAVSYTTMGSFVRYLFDAYGAERLRAVYAWGDFARVYGKPVEMLAAEWEASLHRLDLVSISAAPLARQRFSVPSLFEQRSPHYVPPHVRRTRRAQHHLARGDTLRSLELLEAALEGAPAYPPALDLWARLRLARGETRPVLARLADPARLSATLLVRRADAFALQGEADAARRGYAAAAEAMPAYAHASTVGIRLRAHLADRPPAIAALYGRSAPDTSAAGITLHALRLLGEQPAEAYRMLAAVQVPPEAWPTPGARHLYEAQRLGWQAEAALAAAQFSLAALHARDAASRFEAMGDRNAAAFWRDLAARAAWEETESGAWRSEEGSGRAG